MDSFIYELYKVTSARHGWLHRQPTTVVGPPARVAASLLMVTLLFGSTQVQPVSAQFTTNCNSPDYFVNESLNPQGPNTCQSDCDCDGMRRCSFNRWCTGVARGLSPSPAALPRPPPPPPPSAIPPPPRPAFSILHNLASWRPTYASSKSSESYLAVDGGKRASDSVFETNNLIDSDNWLAVDLQASCYVSYIVLYARKDCCGEHLINTEIRAGAFPFGGMGINALVARLNPYGEGTTGAVYNITIYPPIEARWITVQNFNGNVMPVRKGLALLELEVYGTGSQPPANSRNSGGGGGDFGGSRGGGGGSFRMMYVIPIISGVLVVLSAAFCVFNVARKRLRLLRTASATDFQNAIATAYSMPPPPAAPAPAIGTPVYGMPVAPYDAVNGGVPTFVASVGAGGHPTSEWMRKEQQQRQPGDAAGSSSSSSGGVAPAVMGSPEGVATDPAASPAEPSGSSPCPGGPSGPVLGSGGTAAEALQPPPQGWMAGQGQQPPAAASFLPQGSLPGWAHR